jgi:hypothetical protein
MSAEAYYRKLDRVLDRMGGIYQLPDILERVADGRMQSFTHMNSWLITQVQEYPRAKTMDWIAAVGDLEDCCVIHDQALAFADERSIPLIRAWGRRGWMPFARDRGWRLKTVNQVYMKEM